MSDSTPPTSSGVTVLLYCRAGATVAIVMLAVVMLVVVMLAVVTVAVVAVAVVAVAVVAVAVVAVVVSTALQVLADNQASTTKVMVK